jgi:uncharacterized protein
MEEAREYSAVALDAVVERLVRAYRPEAIWLFGSHARGDVGPDSDYDIAIVVPDDAPEVRRRNKLGHEALRGTGIAVDIIVLRQKSFCAGQHLAASIARTIAAEGRLLYDRRA